MLPTLVSAVNPWPVSFDAGLGWTVRQEYTPEGLVASIVNRAGVPGQYGLDPKETDGWLPVFNAATFGEGWMDGDGHFSVMRPNPDWATWKRRDVQGTFGQAFNPVTVTWEKLVEVDYVSGAENSNLGVMPESVARRRYPAVQFDRAYTGTPGYFATWSNVPFKGGLLDDLGLGVMAALGGFLAAAAAPAVLASQPAAIVQAPAAVESVAVSAPSTIVESLAAQAPVAAVDVSSSIFGPTALDTSSFLVSSPSLTSPALEAAMATVPNVGFVPSGYVVNLANSAELVQASAPVVSLPSVPQFPQPAPATTTAPAPQAAAPAGSSVAQAAKSVVTSAATNAAAGVLSALTGSDVKATQIPAPSNNVIGVWALLAAGGAVALYLIAKG